MPHTLLGVSAVRQAIREFLEYVSVLGRAARTQATYRCRLRYFMQFAFSQKIKDVRNISVDLARKYHHELMDRGLKQSSRLSYMCIVAQFLAWAHERGMILTNVAARMELPKREKSLPPTPLTVDEISQLFDLMPPSSPTYIRNRAILEVFYACGLRRSEVAGLNMGDVSFAERTVFVRGKGGKDRVVPIHDGALRAVSSYLKARGGRPRANSPLFVSSMWDIGNRGRITKSVIDSLFRILRAGFHKHVHPHLLRHTFAVHLLQNGADIRFVQLLLGHESPETTSRYLGLTKADIRQAYDAAIAAVLE